MCSFTLQLTGLHSITYDIDGDICLVDVLYMRVCSLDLDLANWQRVIAKAKQRRVDCPDILQREHFSVRKIEVNCMYSI